MPGPVKLPRPPDDPQLQDLDGVAVAIARMDYGQHTGVIWRDEESNGGLFLLHLRFHYQLVREPLPKTYHWVEACLPAERAIHVAELCSVVSQRYNDGRLAYAFQYRGGGFDLVSGTLLSATGRGLSCATLVPAIFSTVGIDILDLPTWPVRPEDRGWQEKIIRLGRKRAPHDSVHWDYLSSQELGCFRYRP